MINFGTEYFPKAGGEILGSVVIGGTAQAASLDSTPIGQTTPAAGAFTTLTAINIVSLPVNDIGDPGAAGFGVGICPPAQLPAGFTPLPGYSLAVSHPQYGNYQYDDGSVMVWVPKFYYRVGHASNPTFGVHGVNSVDIKSIFDFESTAAANAAGYALHRAFIDGGVEQPGFFVDKYGCSKNAKGSGWVASSIKNANPISTAAAHNPISALSAVSLGDIYASVIQAAKGRTGANGALDASSIFHCTSRFQYAALALLALAHGQASSATTNCAWYHVTLNYPKGNNNNALRDTDDAAVLYTSDGYSNCGKTGSGIPFAKTTHNGQESGIADLNGNMWEIAIGVTAIASTKTISGATKANPCVLTLNNTTDLVSGGICMITAVVGMTQLNDKIYTYQVIDGTTISLNGVDSSAFTDYASAGTLTFGVFYVAKTATAMKNFTPGNTLATDHWGATGVAAMMEAFAPAFKTAAGAFAQRFGSGANQVLSEAVSGAAWLLSGLGLPKDAAGMGTTGTDLFGKDFFYQYIRNELCLLSSGDWGYGSDAGVWNVSWGDYRTNSGNSVGFRCAAYLS